MIKITFPDKAVREYAEGTTAMEIAKSISEGLSRNVLAAHFQRRVHRFAGTTPRLRNG